MDLIIVATCPRRDNVSYLADTLLKLDHEGANEWDAKIVLSDGPLTNCDWPYVVNEGPSGTRIAFWRLLAHARAVGAERVLLLEDDVLPCRNALRFIRQFQIPNDFSFVSFFEMKEDLNPRPGELTHIPCHGLQPPWEPGAIPNRDAFRQATRFYCGNQCLLMPRNTVDYLVNCDPFDPELPQDPHMHGGYSSDGVMGWHLSRSPWPLYGAMYPCLVEHIGEVSTWTQENLDGRRARAFSGDDFDALSLLSAST
jgi:hypothetical protein